MNDFLIILVINIENLQYSNDFNIIFHYYIVNFDNNFDYFGYFEWFWMNLNEYFGYFEWIWMNFENNLDILNDFDNKYFDYLFIYFDNKYFDYLFILVINIENLGLRNYFNIYILFILIINILIIYLFW